MLFKTVVALCLLSIITVSAECPCSKCAQCLAGLLVKSPTQDMRMDCYTVEPVVVSKDASDAEPQVLSKEEKIEKFLRGFKDGVKGLAESVGFPTPDTKQVKDGNDGPAIEPSDLNDANSIDANSVDANSIDAPDLSIAKECAGTAYYVSKTPVTRSISDRKCWRKLTLLECPEGKELMLLKGLLTCFSRTVLKEEATRNLVCFE